MVETGERLFGSTGLAARIERAECGLIGSAGEAALRRSPGEGGFVTPIGGGVAVWAGAGSPLNKVAGLGFGATVGDGELEAIERAFAERGAPVQVELSNLATGGWSERWTRRGYALVGFENVLGLPLPAAAKPPAAGIDIVESDARDLAAWLDVVVTGFAHADDQGVPSHEEFTRAALEQVMRDLAAASGFRRYLARRDGQPAGGAGLRIGDGVAQLCGAATLPAHRRRGVQSALLAARLAAASAAGCDLAVVTTQPGSRSQQNVQRQGFALLYTRAILLRQP